MKTTLTAPVRDLNYPEIARDISRWLWSYNKWLVVWVSGGIDSAVVSTLSAMSGQALTTLEMPIHQKTDEVNRAKAHIDYLQQKYSQVTRQIIDLTQVYDTMKTLQHSWDTPESEYLSDVNLRSRLRAAQLYTTANRKNALVVGTGNKVEDYGIGFFTKFGDGAVDISPIWDLTKSEVYKLGQELGIHEDILSARPTDWLHPNGATDEDQIGATYNELEWAMWQYDIWKRVMDFNWRAAEVMKIYSERHTQNAHKMQMPPVYQVLDPSKWPEYYGVHQ